MVGGQGGKCVRAVGVVALFTPVGVLEEPSGAGWVLDKQNAYKGKSRAGSRRPPAAALGDLLALC